MKAIITIFALPTELEDLNLTLYNLKRASLLLPDNLIDYKIVISMSLSDKTVDWKKSSLPKSYIKDRTEEITKKLIDWCQYDLYFEYNDEILGTDSHKRKALANNQDSDFFIMVDCDILVSDYILLIIAHSFKSIKEKGLDDIIITPQIMKLWDKSWDVITNNKYLNSSYEQTKETDLFKEIIPLRNKTPNITPINNFKFSGGWYTAISTSLFNKITIPESFGHYGIYDTFIMNCCKLLAFNNLPIRQFVIEDFVCAEYHTQRTNHTIKKHIYLIDRKDHDRNKSELAYTTEMQKFVKKLDLKTEIKLPPVAPAATEQSEGA